MERIIKNEYKARKGLIRVKALVRDSRIVEVEITGDFILYPEEALWCIEDKLRGIRADIEEVEASLREAFRVCKATPVGFSEEDLIMAFISGVA